MTSRLRSAAFWAIPPLFCLWVYWYGLNTWFQQDDFAWLGLRLQVHSLSDFLHAMFAPMAQGTIRPWSERGFFMLFSKLFGMEALPFRLWVFLTQFASLALLGSIARRLTGSWIAGLLAPLLWVANPGLSVPLSWTSAYNQVLCAFFLLLAFHFLLLWVETGRQRYYAAQWATFLLGFGALEINVVYPALACAYTLLCARKYFWRVVPMLPVSALYAVLHRLRAPSQTAEVYRMHWDAAIATTFLDYWTWALGPKRLIALKLLPTWFAPAATVVLTLALVSVLLWRASKRDWLGLFFLAWFAGVLAPVLPLKHHFTDYYLAIPTIGLALWLAWGVGLAARHRWWTGALAAGIVGLYLCSTVPVGRAVSRWYYERGQRVRALALGVARAHELHPGKLILLTGVTSDLFWAGIYDRPFRLYGAEEVYLAPGSEADIERHPEIGPIESYVAAYAVAGRALKREQAVVYEVQKDRLRNITRSFTHRVASAWPDEQTRFLDVGQKFFADLLGPEWYANEGAYRWMPRRATLRLGGPRTAAERLRLAGFCAEGQLSGGPVTVTVTVSGEKLPPATVTRSGPFDLEFPLPEELIGRREVDVAVEVNRTFQAPPDPRSLGLAFGTFAIR